MNPKENMIIESLLNEEESVTMSMDKTNADELTSWFKIKKEINLAKKINKNSSPDIHFTRDSKHLKPILHPGFLFPRVSPLRGENHSMLPPKVQKIITIKPKITQKTVHLNEAELRQSSIHNRKQSDCYIKRQSKKSSVFKKPENRNFSMMADNPSSPYFLFTPSNKLIKYKKIQANGFTSSLFDKYYKNSSSNANLDNSLSNKLKSKNTKSKLEVSELAKPDSESRLYQKSVVSDSKKLKKNFLLSPIMENLCKYSSVLK